MQALKPRLSPTVTSCILTRCPGDSYARYTSEALLHPDHQQVSGAKGKSIMDQVNLSLTLDMGHLSPFRAVYELLLIVT